MRAAGKYTFKNGDTYEGEFNSGKAEGRGEPAEWARGSEGLRESEGVCVLVCML